MIKRDATIEIVLTAIMVWVGISSFALIFQADILWDAAKLSPIPLALWSLIKVVRLQNQ